MIWKRFFLFNKTCVVWTKIKCFIEKKVKKTYFTTKYIVFYYDMGYNQKSILVPLLLSVDFCFRSVVEKLWMKQMCCHVFFFIFTFFLHSNYLLNWFFNTFGAHPKCDSNQAHVSFTENKNKTTTTTLCSQNKLSCLFPFLHGAWARLKGK